MKATHPINYFPGIMGTIVRIAQPVNYSYIHPCLNVHHTMLIHRDPIKMHQFCLGLYFTNCSIKMKNYFTMTIGRVLSLISEILSKIGRGVLEKTRIL